MYVFHRLGDNWACSFSRLRLVDFRFGKKLSGERTFTICGMTDSLGPEIIQGKGHTYAADWLKDITLNYPKESERTDASNPQKFKIFCLKRFSKQKIKQLGKEAQVLKEKDLMKSLIPSTFTPQIICTCADQTHIGILLNTCLACPFVSILHTPLDGSSARFSRPGSLSERSYVQGKLTYGKIGEWRFDKRSYLRGPPPRNLSLPPPGVPESVVMLVTKVNEATANIPGWDTF
ncbi:hypothetical protein IFM89_022737 [Coptis chinensis]|uniref:Hydroxyproline O-arabinosyltransferase-like domain-containing protein n=1 Tax=Coptis chinensis TaxID=261450 RepID=A0A835ID30_9MAGN|nr:hypothetical protein IFM89_022737 [Coptis chinensis]